MRLAIVGSVGVPASYGGFETLVEHLIEDESFDYTVYCSGKHYRKRLETYKDARLVYLPLHANGVSSIFYDVCSVLHGIATGHQIFLILGTSGAIIIPLVRWIKPSIRIFVNIDGIEWKRSKWHGLARWYLKFSESIAVRYCNRVVADNDAIANYVLNTYHKECETIAYGGDHARVADPRGHSDYAERYQDDYFLAICRIEPENNVKMLLHAFSQIKKRLVVIGNWQSTEFGRKLFSRYQRKANLHLLDPIYDVEMLQIYRMHCHAYIHGHSAGGTNPSLVEIMHFAKPVIAFDCVYNRSSMENRGLYFKDSDHLQKIATTSELRRDPEMLEIAQRNYTWKIIRRKYAKLFMKSS